MVGRGDRRTGRRSLPLGITFALEWASRGAGTAISDPCGGRLPGNPGRVGTGERRPGGALPQVSTDPRARLLPLHDGGTGAGAAHARERRVCLMKWVTWE